jgi:hypothetical protein
MTCLSLPGGFELFGVRFDRLHHSSELLAARQAAYQLLPQETRGRALFHMAAHYSHNMSGLEPMQALPSATVVQIALDVPRLEHVERAAPGRTSSRPDCSAMRFAR